MQHNYFPMTDIGDETFLMIHPRYRPSQKKEARPTLFQENSQVTMFTASLFNHPEPSQKERDDVVESLMVGWEGVVREVIQPHNEFEAMMETIEAYYWKIQPCLNKYAIWNFCVCRSDDDDIELARFRYVLHDACEKYGLIEPSDEIVWLCMTDDNDPHCLETMAILNDWFEAYKQSLG